VRYDLMGEFHVQPSATEGTMNAHEYQVNHPNSTTQKYNESQEKPVVSHFGQ
jgi:hypothetical protein